MAFKYLSWALFPLLVCYAVYSLIYVEHKGWYSWILSMLYGFLLTFGEFMWSIITTPFSYMHLVQLAFCGGYSTCTRNENAIKRDLHAMPILSLHCKLVPVQSWEYKYGPDTHYPQPTKKCQFFVVVSLSLQYDHGRNIPPVTCIFLV